MSVTSLYLPPQGLQGEKIPSHIVWNGLDVKEIVLEIPTPFEILNVYNAKTWILDMKKIIIKDILWNGYIGLVFNTYKISELEKEFIFKYNIILSNNEILSYDKKIKLFRPQLKLENSISKMNVNIIEGKVNNQLKLKNIGEGYLIIGVTTQKASEVELIESIEVKSYIERFINDLLEEINNLINEYKNYETILEESKKWFYINIFEWNSERKKEYIDFYERFRNIVTIDEKFRNSFSNAFIKVFVKNTEIIKQLERFIQGFESLISNNLMIINPYDKIKIKKGEQKLKLNIKQTDMILNDYDDLEIPEIIISSKLEGELPIYKLFKKDVK